MTNLEKLRQQRDELVKLAQARQKQLQEKARLAAEEAKLKKQISGLKKASRLTLSEVVRNTKKNPKYKKAVSIIGIAFKKTVKALERLD